MKSWIRSKSRATPVQRDSSKLPHCPMPSRPLTLPVDSPADFILDTVSIDYHSPEAEQKSTDRLNKIVAAWGKSKLPSSSNSTFSHLNFHKSPDNFVANYRSSAPFWTAFPVSIDRSFKSVFLNSCSFIIPSIRDQ